MNRLRDGALFPALDLVLNTILVLIALTPFIGVALIEITNLRVAIAIAAGVAFVAFLSTAFLVARRKLRRKRLGMDTHLGVRPPRNRAERTGKVKIRRLKK